MSSQSPKAMKSLTLSLKIVRKRQQKSKYFSKIILYCDLTLIRYRSLCFEKTQKFVSKKLVKSMGNKFLFFLQSNLMNGRNLCQKKNCQIVVWIKKENTMKLLICMQYFVGIYRYFKDF